MNNESLYNRLGGYDAIAAVADDLIKRLMADALLGRFWKHRGSDGLAREKQLLIDYLCACTGGPMVYTGRDMPTTHKGMGIGEEDWSAFMGHVNAMLDHFTVPQRERDEVTGFIGTLKNDIVEN